MVIRRRYTFDPQRKVLGWAGTLPLLLLLLPAGLSAQLSGEVDYATKYLFAGVPFAAQGDGEVSRGTLNYQVAEGLTVSGFGVWDYNTTGFSELDLYAEFSREATPLLGYYVGAIFYNFLINEESWDSSFEVWGGVTLNAPLSPTFHVAHDFELGDGTRAFLQLSEGIPFGPGGFALDLAGRVEYNAEYYTPASGFAYADFVASTDLDLGLVTVTPALTIQRQLDEAFTGFIDDAEVFSIALSFEF